MSESAVNANREMQRNNDEGNNSVSAGPQHLQTRDSREQNRINIPSFDAQEHHYLRELENVNSKYEQYITYYRINANGMPNDKRRDFENYIKGLLDQKNNIEQRLNHLKMMKLRFK